MSEEKEDKTSKINWSSEKIMSISALFVSAISLFALFYQLNLAREENELIRKQQSASVLPHLSQWFSNTNDGFKVIFGNKGVGPAFIKQVKLEINDTVFYNTDHLINYSLRQIYKNDSISIPASTSTFSEGYVLPANDVIEILVVKKPEHIKIYRNYLAKSELDYTITYADVYGAEWILSNKNDNKVYPVPSR
ncbi:hypothetical protein AAON49_11295 [Pseudotenacibaculum sp. MALMAid0570]|uniref:hypothetical protein n=1 Tax=Pseudotenacibaculum sp. MALMAid0570 TaxID=3143938 RepID=UPI0032E04E1B